MWRVLWVIFAVATFSASAMAQGVVPTIPFAPPVVSTEVDTEGTITLGGTAQTIATADSVRFGAILQNNSQNDMWISTTTTAGVNIGERVPAGAWWKESGRFVGVISLYGVATGDSFFLKVW